MPVEEQGMTLAHRRIWVVGCGFLGSCLLAQLRGAGAFCLGIDPAGGADVVGDAAHPAVQAAARCLLEPELIICCAATHGGDAASYRRTYLDLPRALVAAFPAARLLFCSSSSVYGGQGGAQVAEASPLAATVPSARRLMEAEDFVGGLGAAGCVARLVPLYAEGRCELLRRHLDREPELPGEESRWLNYVHREDAARALLLLTARLLGVGGACPACVNVGADAFRKGEAYAHLAGLSGMPRVGVSRGGGPRAVLNQRVDVSLLRSLGWVPQHTFWEWVAIQLELRRGLC